jgi:hypothetical protein
MDPPLRCGDTTVSQVPRPCARCHSTFVIVRPKILSFEKSVDCTLALLYVQTSSVFPDAPFGVRSQEYHNDRS